jgi:hypothetical protein
MVAWVTTRAWVFLHLGYQREGTVDLQDVKLFSGWTDLMSSTHSLPVDAAWQYPPGSVGVFMLPSLFPGPHSAVYLTLFLLCDLAVLVLLLVAERRRRLRGTWVWVVGIPLLLTLPLLRFDLVPTAIAVAALLAIRARRSSVVVGVIVGVGAAVKAWPVLVLVAVMGRRSMLTSLAVATGVGLLATVVVELVFGDSLSFLTNQAGRGLQIESVGATPWYVLQAVFGEPVVWLPRNGSLELGSETADAVAGVLRVAMIVAVVLIAAVWFLATRRGRHGDAQLGRFGSDLAYAAVLVYVVLSPVLSPQYFVWLVGVGAVVLTDPDSRMVRPVCLMLGAAGLTTALLSTWGGLLSNGSDAAFFLVARNALLVVALVDGLARLAPDIRSMLTPSPKAAHRLTTGQGQPVAGPTL